jgi:hypothetical protein
MRVGKELQMGNWSFNSYMLLFLRIITVLDREILNGMMAYTYEKMVTQ